MLVFPLLSFAFSVCATTVQAFVARCAIGHTTPPSRLLMYGVTGATAHLALQCCPALIPRILLETTVHLALQILIFRAGLFPEALIGIAFPISLGFSTSMILPPLVSWLLETPLSNRATTFLILLPSFILALYYLLVKAPSQAALGTKKKGGQPSPFMIIIFAVSILLHVKATLPQLNQNYGAPPLGSVYIVVGMALAPIVAAALLLQLRKIEAEQRRAEFHALKHRVLRSALQALREERHEYLNKLALISTYLQMGEWQKAQHCIDFAAASLLQEQNKPTLPEDAWLAVLEAQRQAAAVHNIDFTVRLNAQAPRTLTEQRLLPRLIFNLVDNAFTAAACASNPKVTLLWEQRGKQRILQVVNNGPPITATEARRIFLPGVTTKQDAANTHGWGLVICRRIAEELKGTLTYESSKEHTTFTLALPLATITEGERAHPAP